MWQWDNNDPFGNNMPNADPNGTGTAFEFNLRFAGQYFDKETNLHYNYFRTYDPATGRYIESDPIGLAGGINTFAYVRGNPISKTDRLGLVPNPAEGACFAGPNPICIGGIVADALTTIAAIGSVTTVASMAGDTKKDAANDPKYCPPPPPPSPPPCAEWKKQIIVPYDNTLMIEGMTGRIDGNGRAIYSQRAAAYNASCSGLTGPVPGAILTDVE